MIPLSCWLSCSIQGTDVTLPYILSDNMVLQRDIPVSIWGWAKPGEKVTVAILKQKVSVKADAKGEWKAKLNPLPAGGPFEVTITGKNTIILKNILAGDVWVCSGQSNMEFPFHSQGGVLTELPWKQPGTVILCSKAYQHAVAEYG
jgi:sialate O-acetylesterase